MTDEELREIGVAFLRKKLGGAGNATGGNAAKQSSTEARRKKQLQREQTHAHNLTPEDELEYVTNNGGIDAALKTAPTTGQSFESYRNERRTMDPNYAYASPLTQEGLERGYFQDWYKQTKKSDPDYASNLIDSSFVNAKNAEFAQDQQDAQVIATHLRPESKKYVEKKLGKNASLDDITQAMLDLSVDNRSEFNKYANESAKKQDSLLDYAWSGIPHQFAGMAQDRAVAHRAEAKALEGGYSQLSPKQNAEAIANYTNFGQELEENQPFDPNSFYTQFGMLPPSEVKAQAQQLAQTNPEKYNQLALQAQESAAEQAAFQSQYLIDKFSTLTEEPVVTSRSGPWDRCDMLPPLIEAGASCSSIPTDTVSTGYPRVPHG